MKPCKDAELEFYESAVAHPAFAYYMPQYFGRVSLSKPNPSDAAEMDGEEEGWAPSGGGMIRTGSGCQMENLEANYRKVNVLDVKLGARLWADDAPQAKREKLENVSNSTTSGALGIRITAMRVYTGQNTAWSQEVSDDYLKYGKNFGRSLTVDTIQQGFEKFFRIDAGEVPNEDIKKVLRTFILDLEGLQRVLEAEECRIYSSSLLFLYEGDPEALRAAIDLRENLSDVDHSNAVTTSTQPTRSTDTCPQNERALREGHISTQRLASGSAPLSLQGILEPDEADAASDDAIDGWDSDSDSELPSLRIQALKLIDFAHAQWTHGQGPDENVLFGIRNVIRILSELYQR